MFLSGNKLLTGLGWKHILLSSFVERVCKGSLMAAWKWLFFSHVLFNCLMQRLLTFLFWRLCVPVRGIVIRKMWWFFWILSDEDFFSGSPLRFLSSSSFCPPRAEETCWVISLSCTLYMPRLLSQRSSKYGWATFSAHNCLIASYITESRCRRFQLAKLPHASLFVFFWVSTKVQDA